VTGCYPQEHLLTVTVTVTVTAAASWAVMFCLTECECWLVCAVPRVLLVLLAAELLVGRQGRMQLTQGAAGKCAMAWALLGPSTVKDQYRSTEVS
jgi:hypothetical protein